MTKISFEGGVSLCWQRSHALYFVCVIYSVNIQYKQQNGRLNNHIETIYYIQEMDLDVYQCKIYQC